MALIKTETTCICRQLHGYAALFGALRGWLLCRLPPWANKWLLGAIALSMLLHCFILYVPWAAVLFSVAPLSAEEWLAILCLSFPVVIVDELLKIATRYATVTTWQLLKTMRPVCKISRALLCLSSE